MILKNAFRKKSTVESIKATVLWLSMANAVVFTAIIILRKENILQFENVLHDISTPFGWFFIIPLYTFMILLLTLAFSKYGNNRSGGKHNLPLAQRVFRNQTNRF